MMYICGLDLGQVSDYTALSILTYAQRPATYDVVELRRFPLETPYPVIVRDVQALLATPPLMVAGCPLVIDQTGCGRPVFDAFCAARLPSVVGVSIHGGDSVTRDGANWRVPKRDLVGTVQILLQQRRLRIAAGLPEAPVLTQELLNFRVRIDPATAHDSYSAWREADHDDLVLAVALACWWGERYAPARVVRLLW